MSNTNIDTTHYGYRVNWSAEDDEFVGSCVEFPSLSWLAATQAEALQGIKTLVDEVVADLTDQHEVVPEPVATRTFSGRFNLRVGEALHRQLALQAAEEQLSLNQYIVRRLSDAS